VAAELGEAFVELSWSAAGELPEQEFGDFDLAGACSARAELAEAL